MSATAWLMAPTGSFRRRCCAMSGVRPLRVVLFGSGGRGEAGADSDLDLAVILPDDAPAALLHWRAANEARRGHHLAVDSVPLRLSPFATAAQHVGSLPWIIATAGRMIWQREPATAAG